MKQLLTLLITLAIGISWGQTFTTSPGTAIPSNTTISSDITVTGIGVIDCDFGLAEVCIDINHTYDADLDIFLDDPNGDAYLLTSDNGGSGNNYIVTCFNMTAGTNVTAGTAPFNGSFIPEGDLALANNGQDADGTWTLRVRDDAGGDVGTLNSWSLEFQDDPECIVPTTADCAGGTTVCSDVTFTGNSSGSGNFDDLDASNDGCLSGENESSWYYFQAASDGTYAFIIETAVDYDFAVWGPLTELACPPVGAPIRCSYSGVAGDTGLEAGAGDLTEGAGGDAVVDPIVALEDDIYIICIDNFTSDGTSFDLVWDLSGGASFDCTLLPIDLIVFKAEQVGHGNLIEWRTKSELNNSHYTLETSNDGINWEYETEIAGAGNSSSELNYSYTDYTVDSDITYYRLSQTDFDGKNKKLGTISVQNGAEKEVEKIINLMGAEVNEDYNGLKVYIYTDGSMLKVISQ
ncbi:MAG: subtilisin-like proprotein convertase family protein [Crocinitomix sp.]|jgi:subtilisin-like proprotein convertase family protein